MHTQFIKPVVLACLALGALQAKADTLKFSDFTHGSQTVNFSLKAPNVKASDHVYAGGLSAVLNNSESFTAYCVDLYQPVDFKTYGGYSPVKAADYSFANKSAHADLGKLFSAGHVVNNATKQAAFQIAVWEIVYETSGKYDLGKGAATFNGGSADKSGALKLASGWLGNLGGTSDVQLTVFAHNKYQDMVMARPVPEPSTYALMAGGLMALGFVSRRRAKQRKEG
jgi:hypothetical protein